MSEEFDPNEIAANVLMQNIDGLLSKGTELIKKVSNKIYLKRKSTYYEYMSELISKYSKVKSFLLRGNPVLLYDFYIYLDLKQQTKQIKNVEIKDIVANSKNTIIVGSGGSGKTMLIRHLLMGSLYNNNKVPIFIELRQFNFFKNSLIALIIETLKTYKFEMSIKYIINALEVGHFILFLDGYDEVAQDQRKKVKTLIIDFVKTYNKNPVILTSRPDPELEGWQDFSLFEIAPLTEEKAYALIDKIPFDDRIKDSFLKDLKAKLYIQHKSFLSNPLLLSIMLLSYGPSVSIPNKLSVFYNQAYEALFERHDVLKEGFKRNHFTELDIQDFERIFSAFCLQTYDIEKIEFTNTEALDNIKKSLDIVGIKCKYNDYLNDLIQNTCLLVRDGLNIAYTHRSFQEYFTARFILNTNPKIQMTLINKYSNKIIKDNVFNLLYEMQPDIIEHYFIIPELDYLFEKIKYKQTLGITNFVRFVQSSFTHFFLDEKNPSILDLQKKDTKLMDRMRFENVIRFTLYHYGYLYGWSNFSNDNDLKNICKNWKNIIKDTKINIEDKKNHQFLSEMSKTEGFYSLKTLQIVLNIREDIKNKAETRKISLENILNIK